MLKFINPQIQEENEPILVLNTSCQIQSFNDFAAQLFNLTERDNNVLQLDELSKSRWISFVKKLHQQKVGYCHLKLKVGSNPYKEVKIIGYFNEKENLITAKILVHALENSQSSMKSEIFYSLFNEVSHGIIVSDSEGMIMDVNNVALTYLKCDRADIIHSSHESLINSFHDFKFQNFQYLALLFDGGTATIELSKENYQGEQDYYKLETAFNFITKQLVTTITDITEVTRLKQQVDQQKGLCSVGEMATSIVHEIRNPMTSLKGFLDLMKKNSNNESASYIQIMDSELERMDTILSELLYLSKPARSKMDKIPIYKIMNEVIELMQQSAVNNNIVLQLKVVQAELFVTTIVGNEIRLKELFINLIKNAIEVMECGGMITIELNQTSEQMIQVSVQDEGAGITDEDQNQLFAPFYTTKESGTGLGLALVKKVVEEHRGTINVESTVGVGTTFMIELPTYTSEQNSRMNDFFINNNSIQ